MAFDGKGARVRVEENVHLFGIGGSLEGSEIVQRPGAQVLVFVMISGAMGSVAVMVVVMN